MDRTRAASLAVSAVLLVGGCGKSGGSGAAEPAEAPPAASPAGQVIAIGEHPEGTVADPVTHLVAVGVRNPTALVLVDGRSGTVSGRVPLPSRLRHLQLAAPGGPVLVPLEGTGALATVHLPDGVLLSQVPIGRYAHDATATADGTVAVADEMGKALVLVRDGQAVHRFTDVTQPGGVAATGDLVAMVDVGDHVLALYDAAQTETRGEVAAGDGPTHVVADRHGRFQVADTRGGRLLTFTAEPELHQVSDFPLAGQPYGLAYDQARDRLWVTLTGRNQVVALDLAGGRPRELVRYPTVRQPNTVAVDAGTGRVFVTGTADGTLQLIDPPA